MAHRLLAVGLFLSEKSDAESLQKDVQGVIQRPDAFKKSNEISYQNGSRKCPQTDINYFIPEYLVQNESYSLKYELAETGRDIHF